MNKKKIPAPRRAGTATTFEDVLALIGDDPETMLLAIRLLDRMYEQRVSRRRKKKRRAAY